MTSRRQGSSRAKPAESKQPVDALNLPLPPVTLDFAIRGDAHRDGFYQRYIRKGDINDAEPAMVGKGGFGTAYRFTRDDSFTPPPSMMETTASSGDVEMGASHLRRASSQRAASGGYGVRSATDRAVSESQMPSPQTSNVSLLPNVKRHSSIVTSPKMSRTLLSSNNDSGAPPSPTCANDTSDTGAGGRSTVPRSKAPAVVVVKVCRTPTSGSYDELPKTGIGRAEAKTAAQEIAAGNPVGEHTRIVRGEARLLRYLQMCASLERKKGSQSHVVRLLADIPMPKPRSATGAHDDDEDEASYSGPPVPRLLIFERLVELDAELTPRGWAKNKRVWSVEKVELVAKDAVAGLAFLHEHNVVHGDLKPSNFMRDARTGSIKLIDLGASRRWVRLHNVAKERTTAVEELDSALREGQIRAPAVGEILCEGLGSLTGSPHFMAPEVLLQAGRYLSADGLARNVLDDYVANQDQLPNVQSARYLLQAHTDFKRGWGVKADVWSWGCSAISLLLRTIESAERPSSNSVCAFDFSFESDADALVPLWPLHAQNESLPRFHQWARIYPLRIMDTVLSGVKLPQFCSVLSPHFLHMLQCAFTQVDIRPTARAVTQYLDTHANNNVEYMTDTDTDVCLSPRPISRASLAPSASSAAASMPDEPHNIDLTTTSALSHLSLQQNGTAHLGRAPSEQSNVGLRDQISTNEPGLNGAQKGMSQQKLMQSRLLHSSLGSPASSSPALAHAPSTGITSDGRKSMMAPRPSQLSQTSHINDDGQPMQSDESMKQESPAGQDMALDPSSEGRRVGSSHLPTITLSEEAQAGDAVGRARRSTVTLSKNGNEEDGRCESPDRRQQKMKQRRGSIFARMASTLSLRNNYHKSGEGESASAQAQGLNGKPDTVGMPAGDDAGFEELVNDTSQEEQNQQRRGRRSTLRGLQSKWAQNMSGSRASTAAPSEGGRRISILGNRKPSLASLRGKTKSSFAPMSEAGNGDNLSELGVNVGRANRRASGMPEDDSSAPSSPPARSTNSRTSQDNVLGLELGAHNGQTEHRRTPSGATQTLETAQSRLSASGLGSPTQQSLRGDTSMRSSRSNDARRATINALGNTNSSNNASFLAYDPYAPSTSSISGTSRSLSAAHSSNKSRGVGLDELFDEATGAQALATSSGGIGNLAEQDIASPHVSRRQRSWSSFFKRKKQGV